MTQFRCLLLLVLFVSCTTGQEPRDSDKLLLSVVRGGILRPFTDRFNYVIAADGSGGTFASLPSGLGREPTWSPNGRWVVFVNQAQDNGVRIHIMRSDGTSHIEYQPHQRGNRDPTWSPDGTHIAYFAYDEPNFGIQIANVECLLRGEKCQPKPRFLTRGDLPDWSPDGKHIVFELLDYGATQVYVVRADGSDKPLNLTPNMKHCGRPRWSPDGQRIVFSCAGTIYVMNEEGSGLTKLTEPGDFPTWSPDGNKIAFVSSRDGLGKCVGGLCGSGGIYSNAIFLIDATGSNVIRLSKRDDEEVSWYTWLPSSKITK